MYYDQEKTQGIDPRQEKAFVAAERQMREQMKRESRFGDQIGRASHYADSANDTARPVTEAEILAELFQYHPPTDVTLPKFAAINQAAKNFAEVVLSNCPPSADRSDAIRKIREARMTANAAVALNGLSL